MRMLLVSAIAYRENSVAPYLPFISYDSSQILKVSCLTGEMRHSEDFYLEFVATHKTICNSAPEPLELGSSRRVDSFNYQPRNTFPFVQSPDDHGCPQPYMYGIRNGQHRRVRTVVPSLQRLHDGV